MDDATVQPQAVVTSKLSPEAIVRLGLLYDLLDVSYIALRGSTQLQRAAILRGHLAATLIADMNLTVLSKSVTLAWTEIQSILAPKPDAVPDNPTPCDPAGKETVQ